MTQGYPHGEWYDQSLPETEEYLAEKEPRKRHTGLKITMIVASVLLILVASVYIFSDQLDFLWGGSSGSGSQWNWSAPSSPTMEDELPEDFRSFFQERYSAGSDTHTGSSLKQIPGDPGMSLQLVSAEGLVPQELGTLYQTVIGSIVGIEARQTGSAGYAWGTGVVMSEDGYIITNEHVIDKASTATVVLSDGSRFSASLVGEDVQTDIAVLKIEADGLHPAQFGDSGELSVGDSVVAIGNPLGNELTGTMTNGIVSAINRDIQVNGRRMTLIQTNAALNEGNSGGPLLNVYGQVVGITNMKMVNGSSDVTVEGIGFAIPTSTVKLVTDQLIANGEMEARPGLGITIVVITEDVQAEYGLPDGLYIYAVSDKSDAKAQGVRVGDVLTHVNGQEVHSNADVLAIRDSSNIGDTMVLTIWRDGETLEIPITIGDLRTIY